MGCRNVYRAAALQRPSNERTSPSLAFFSWVRRPCPSATRCRQAPAPAAGTSPATPTAPAAGPAAPPVDVEKILADRAAQSGQTLNWQTSIVDLLKLLGMDSSLTARKTLAAELHYSGDTNDSATMNVWLIKQVMSQLAANGGTVTANLMK